MQSIILGIMDNFEESYNEIYADLQNTPPPPPKKDTIVLLSQDIENVMYGYAGMIQSGKFGSQQLIKLRKSIEKFSNDIVKWTDPRMNVLMANKIHYEHLKQKRLKELLDEK